MELPTVVRGRGHPAVEIDLSFSRRVGDLPGVESPALGEIPEGSIEPTCVIGPARRRDSLPGRLVFHYRSDKGMDRALRGSNSTGDPLTESVAERPLLKASHRIAR